MAHNRKGFGPFNTGAREIAARLKDYRARYVAGDKVALLEAVDYCLFNQVVAPHWIVRGFGDAFARWKGARGLITVVYIDKRLLRGKHVVRPLPKTLDEAFELPKGLQLKAKQEQRQLMFAIYATVEKAKRCNVPIGGDLFEEIGEELKVGKTRVKQYLAAARRELKEQIAEQKRRNPNRKIFSNTWSGSADLQARLDRIIEGRKK